MLWHNLNLQFSFLFNIFFPDQVDSILNKCHKLISLICLMLRMIQLLRVQDEQVMLFKFSLQKNEE